MDFLFTETGFALDGEGTFSNDNLYDLCFMPLERGASATEMFLKLVADGFLSALMSSTGLELERDKVEPDFDRSSLEEIASQVPFAIGSGFVDWKWVRRQMNALLEIYRKEIASFSGSVDLYLRNRDSTLSMPTRIYFHLVINPNGESPFAFMATYTTADGEGGVHHYPLRYALSQYGDNLTAFCMKLICTRRQASYAASRISGREGEGVRRSQSQSAAPCSHLVPFWRYGPLWFMKGCPSHVRR